MYSLVITWTLFTNLHYSYITMAYNNAVVHSKNALKETPLEWLIMYMYMCYIDPSYIHTYIHT